ncbi:MAG: UbiA family prenyltransferase [Candidatus Paceibacterota bacterium]
MTLNPLKALIEKIENNKQISFGVVFLLIYIVSFLRGFLENYANFDNGNRIMGVIDTYFHYPLWFFMGFISVFIFLRLFTGEKIEKVSRLGAIFSWLVILSPILDIIIQKGNQVRYVFIVGDFSDLVHSFLSFFGGIAGRTTGATLGMKIELALGLLGLGYYVFYKTKNIWRSFFCVLAIYAVTFFFISMPVYIFAADNAITNDYREINYQTTNYFYYRQEPADAITKDRTFVVENGINGLTESQKINNQYSATLSIIFLITDILLLGWWLWLYDAKKFIAVIKNFRLSRIIHYSLMASVGIYLGMKFAGYNPIGSLFDFTSLACLFLCLIFSWAFSVWENDEADLETDKISNSDRPLIRGSFTNEEWRNLKYLFLFLALSSAFLGGFYLFTFTVLFLIVYHLYSAPPLRLKRFLGASSFITAINGLIAVLMGFFMVAGTENLRNFPVKYALGIFLIIFLLAEIKNLKDIEGDAKEGVKTLPAFFGPKNGKAIVGVLAFFGLLLIPVTFYLNVITLITAAVFGIILFFVINKEKFKEKYVVIVYLIFIAVFAVEAAMFSLANSFDARSNQAAVAGWRWLYQYDKNFADPGIPMMIKMINDKYCHSPKAEVFWKGILKEFENHSYLPVFERFFSNRADYKKISDKALTILKTPQTFYNDVLPQALYCDLYPVREDFTAKAFDNIETETGYDLTHKFWSAVLFKENGCVAEGYDLDKIILTAAQKMASDEEKSGKVDDLYVERAAFLENYGFKNLVKESWIKNIMDNQLKSGAWINSVEGVGNPHTTTLSIWTLAKHSGICPFQE